MTPRRQSSRRGSKTQFAQILQDDIMHDDSSWRYRVPSLPPPTETEPHNLIKSIRLVSNRKDQYIELSLEEAEPLRAMRGDPLHAFIVVSFSSFTLQMPAAGLGQRRQPAPPLDTANYIAKLLKTGITINNQEYNFYGHSINQLQSRSCYFFAASKRTIEQKIDAMADMTNFRSIAKKVKRIGLLFISSEVTTTLDPEFTEEIDDITRNGYVFTDGCGLLASSLAKQIAKKKNIAHRNISYVSSVFQIRYRGYKGVLMVSPALKGGKLAQFRPSMRKLDNVTDDRLFVINHSKVDSTLPVYLYLANVLS
jgi:regulator of nonsense transcripts 1